MENFPEDEPFSLRSIGRRLVLGEDVIELQEYFAMTLLDIMFVMGNYGGRFHNIVEPSRLGNALKSVPRSLLVRTLIDWHLEGRSFPARGEMFPSPLLIPKPPHHKELLSLFDRYGEEIEQNWPGLTKTNATIILGLSGKNVTKRWDKTPGPGEKTSAPQPVVQRMLTYLIADIRNRGMPAMVEHMHRVEDEAIARRHLSLDDLLKRSRWNTNKDILKLEAEMEKRQRRREKRAEAKAKQNEFDVEP